MNVTDGKISFHIITIEKTESEIRQTFPAS